MPTNRSLALLSLLSKAELTAFSKLLDSPFFTKKEFLKPLFEALRGLKTEPDAQRIFKKVFPEKSFDLHVWHKALSDLNEQLEAFLVLQNVQKNDAIFRLAFAFELAQRPDDELFEAAFRDARQAVAAQPDHSERLAQLFRLHKVEFMFPSKNGLRSKAAFTIDDLEQHLDAYYSLAKIQLAVARAGRAELTRTDLRATDFATLKTQAQPFRDEKRPLLEIYLRLLDLFEKPAFSVESRSDFETFFWEKQAEIARHEAETIVRHLLNFDDLAHRRGVAEASKHSFELFAKAQEAELFQDFQNEDLLLRIGVNLAAHGSEVDLTTFLTRFPAKMPAVRRAEASHLFWAYHYFHRSEFEKCLEQTNQISNRYPAYSLRIYSLQVRGHAELILKQKDTPDSAALDAALARFSSFLARNEFFGQPWLDSYKNLVRFISLLTKRPFVSKNELLAELEKRPAACGDWAVRKVQQTASRRPNF